jgi:hypothetical protein
MGIIQTFHQTVIASAQDEIVAVRPFPALQTESPPSPTRLFLERNTGRLLVFFYRRVERGCLFWRRKLGDQ